MTEQEIEAFTSNKDSHIIDRFDCWLDSEYKQSIDYDVTYGPMRKYCFDDDYSRKIYIVNQVLDTLLHPSDCIPEFTDKDFSIDFYDANIDLKKTKQSFDSLQKEDKQLLTSILEDAIEQNVESIGNL